MAGDDIALAVVIGGVVLVWLGLRFALPVPAARRLPPDDEAERLLRWHGMPGCMETINQQLQVLQTRSQLLLTLATLTLTITGFSGPKIAQTNALARGTMAGGLVLVLMATVLVLLGALRIHWITQVQAETDRETLTAILGYRNRKTALYRAQLVLLVLGLASYVTSVVTYLMYG